jgi:hypothetical protein
MSRLTDPAPVMTKRDALAGFSAAGSLGVRLIRSDSNVLVIICPLTLWQLAPRNAKRVTTKQPAVFGERHPIENVLALECESLSFQKELGGKIWRPSRLKNAPEQKLSQQIEPGPMMSGTRTGRPGFPSLDA